MKERVIFDFDGVLADTLELVIEFGHANQNRFMKQKITKDDFRTRSMREALKHVGLPFYKLPRFVREVKNHIGLNLTNVELFPDIKGFIKELSDKNKKLYIMSSNSKLNIEKVLSKNDLIQYFETIYSDSSLFGKHKTLSKMCAAYGISKKDSIYIGDEIRDYEACKKFEIDFIAVSWGYDSFERLKKAEILNIANSIDELKLLLNGSCLQ